MRLNFLNFLVIISKMRHNFIPTMKKLCRIVSHIYMKLGRVRHNFVFECEAISATQLRFPVASSDCTDLFNRLVLKAYNRASKSTISFMN